MGLVETMRRRRLLAPSVMTALALPVLLGLGYWQLQRLEWKNGLIAAISERTRLAPIGLEEALARRKVRGDVEYVRVSARGRFHHDKERFLYHPEQQRGPGFHVYTPLELAGSGTVIVVNRGWLPESLKPAAERKAGQTEGETEVVGLLREPEQPGYFTPENDVARNTWFWRDLAGMLASMFDGAPPAHAPVFLEAEGEAVGGWPKGGVTNVTLPNRHLEYAITWFGLAGALVAVYLAFVAARLRGD